MNIVLKKFLKTTLLVSPEKAQKVRTILINALVKGKEISLDFSEINTVSLSFLYFLFRDMDKELTKVSKELMTFKNPTNFLMDEIQYLKDNYTELSNKFKKYEIDYLLV
ncbi:MAG: STAS-like domain-containing protein [Fusobacteriaceae bacterium]